MLFSGQILFPRTRTGNEKSITGYRCETEKDAEFTNGRGGRGVNCELLMDWWMLDLGCRFSGARFAVGTDREQEIYGFPGEGERRGGRLWTNGTGFPWA